MKGVEKLAADVAAARRPVAADNPFLAVQTLISNQILASLDSYRAMRDHFAERAFFAFYGSPLVQVSLGLGPDSIVRPSPGISPEKLAARQAQADACADILQAGGFDEALTRAALYVVSADRALDQRSAFALNVSRKRLMHLSLAAFKAMVRNQFSVLQFEPNRAIEALPAMVPQADARRTCWSKFVQSWLRAERLFPPNANASSGCRKFWKKRRKARRGPRNPSKTRPPRQPDTMELPPCAPS